MKLERIFLWQRYFVASNSRVAAQYLYVGFSRRNKIPRFAVHTISEKVLRFISRSSVIRPIDALDILCAQLTRDLFAIAKFLSETEMNRT